jgi:hypothetical protein
LTVCTKISSNDDKIMEEAWQIFSAFPLLGIGVFEDIIGGFLP